MMYKQLRQFWLAIITVIVTAALWAVSASAAPARSVEQQFTQPDGTAFIGTSYGDETFAYVLADDGTVLERQEDGFWHYAGTNVKYLLEQAPAAPVSREDWVRAHQERPAPEPQGDAAAPQYLSGKQNLLVLLVDFNDVSIQYEANWPQQIFGETKSLKAFYNETTGGYVNVLPAAESYGAANDGIVRVKLNYNHPNSGARNQISLGAIKKGVDGVQITRDAIKAADPYVDFAAYDRNGNKKIEPGELHIMVVCAGYEMSYNQNLSPAVWGHRANLALSLYGKLADKCSFDAYTQFGELEAHSSTNYHMATIGIICHEFGHDLGLPDLYGADNSPLQGLGGYSLMADGSWASLPGEESGETPASLDAYCLEKLGAFNLQTIPAGGSFDGNINTLSTGSKNILKIQPQQSDHEYFLVENRQYEGYDRGILRYASSDSQGGLAVYYVNTDYKSNLNAEGQLVTLLEANGEARLQNNAIWNTDAFYYADGERNVFLDHNTNPAARWADQSSAWFRLECKSESSLVMRAAIASTLYLPKREITIHYRSGKAALQASNGLKPLEWKSANTAICTVDNSGNVKAGRAIGTTLITATDAADDWDICTVHVKYVWWQWLIRIFLLGFLWY